MVSGAVALLLEQNPDLTPDQVKALLTDTAGTMRSHDRFAGEGLLDNYAAAKAPVPTDAEQTWTPSTGLGSLEAARGDDHLTINGALRI